VGAGEVGCWADDRPCPVRSRSAARWGLNIPGSFISLDDKTEI
jgi:hypothetical protein